jgi:hypothetical protein
VVLGGCPEEYQEEAGPKSRAETTYPMMNCTPTVLKNFKETV